METNHAGFESVVVPALVVAVTPVAGFAVAVGGLESVGAFESVVTAFAAAGFESGTLESVGTLESLVLFAAAFTATLTLLHTVFPLTLVQILLVVNLVAAVAEVAPNGAARATTVTVPRAIRMMWLRGFFTSVTIPGLGL